MKNKKLHDRDCIFLSAMLRAREARMLTDERLLNINAASSFTEAAKLVEESGYPDMSGMNDTQIDAALGSVRAARFDELDAMYEAKRVVDMFRLKYDYHNVKVLAKAMGDNLDGAAILSNSGRVSAADMTDAFNTGERHSLPPLVAEAMSEAVRILSHTENPQLSDIAVDARYFKELCDIAEATGNSLIIEYARFLVDSANLRAAVRTLRMGRGYDFLKGALVPGGDVPVDKFAALTATGEELPDMYKNTRLADAAALGAASIAGGTLTAFELAADDALAALLEREHFVTYGPETILKYLAAVENEITSIRMLLTGKLTGIAPDTVQERMRRSYV